MYITKILETTIDLLDPNDIYSSDINNVIIKKLQARYNGKCYQSIYIVDIVRIIRRSPIMMVDNRLDGGSYVDTQFEVRGIVLSQDEILHGCEIIEIHANNTIIAKHQYAAIKLQKEPRGNISSVLTIGQKIPIIVQKVRYSPNKSSISVIGLPFIPTKSDEPVYNIIAGLNADEKEKVKYLLELIKTEEELHTGVSEEKNYSFFKDILYPYKNDQKFEQSKIATELSLKPISFEFEELINLKNGTIYYPAEDNKSNKRLFHIENDNILDNASNLNNNTTIKDLGILVINSSLYAALASILNKYLMYLQALRGFAETYTSPESMQNLIPYWRICKGLQIQT